MQPPDAPDGIAPELPDGAQPADLQAVQDAYEAALDDLLVRWLGFTTEQANALLVAIEGSVSAGDVLALLNIVTPIDEAARLLEETMMALGNDAAQMVVHEARSQGVEDGAVHATPPDRLWVAQHAQTYATQTSRFVIASAVGEALRVWSPGRKAADVRDDVAEHLDSLTDAYPRLVLGGALSQAQMTGRTRTMLGGPEAALYSDEVLDKNTCKPCRDVNRKWIGNASDTMPPLTYPVAGYIGCLGRWRCRGQVVAVWRGGDNWREWVELPAQRRG